MMCHECDWLEQEAIKIKCDCGNTHWVLTALKEEEREIQWQMPHLIRHIYRCLKCDALRAVAVTVNK